MKKSISRFRILCILTAVLAVVGSITVLVVCQGNYEEMKGWQRTVYAIFKGEEIRNTKYVGEVSTDTWNPEDEYKLEDTNILMKDPDKDFVVMNVTDLHHAEYDYTYLNNVRANRDLYYIKMKAEELQPDLITFSGDIFSEDGGSNIYSVHRLTEYMDSLEIPWAIIFDYHDWMGNCDLNYIADIMMESEYCLLKKGDPNLGIANYVINICEERDGKTEVVHSILMMDSHHGNVWENQIEWYKWATTGVNKVNGSAVTSTVITHVPIAQYTYAYEEAWDAENNCWRDEYEAFGIRVEEPCGEEDENGNPVDNGFFAAMKEIGTTTNFLCGHEHINSDSILYQGIRLTYSLRIGYGGYWDDSFETDTFGVTTITIDSEGTGTVEHSYMNPSLKE